MYSLTAEQIAYALDKRRRTGKGRWSACCPAHHDKSPSLSITQARDKVLVKCWSGCSQTDVIEALRARGLWPERKRRPANVQTLVDRREMRAFVAAHEHNLKRGIPTSTKHQRLYWRYQRVIYAPFSPGEVMTMRLFCFLYQADLKAGRTPTPKDDEMFLGFSRLVYEFGAPYGY